MSWFSVLRGLLNLANVVAKHMADKQLLDAGQYKAIAESNAHALKKIKAADDARLSLPIDGVSDDPNNRDNK
jgi:hypothetical protein